MIPHTSLQGQKDGWQSFLHDRLAHREREVFTVMLFDHRGLLFNVRDLFEGSSSQVQIRVPELMRFVSASGAAAVIVAHNHVEHGPEPSEQDEKLTARLHLAFALLGIALKDHVIVSARSTYSMARRGPWKAPLEEFKDLIEAHTHSVA